MRIVIVGAGLVGMAIARELIKEKHDVVLIEQNPETARLADNELDCLIINDDGSRPETLRSARIDTADWFISMTGSDSVNIVACGLVSAESKRTRTIARVETPFYSALSKAQRDTFGIDWLVNPALEAARQLVRIVAQGFSGAVYPLHNGALQLRTVNPTDLPSFVGHTLGELRQSALRHFLVAAVVREGAIIVPKGDCRIEETDRLYVLGPPDSLDALLGKVHGLDDAIRRVLVLGATRVSERIIEYLGSDEPVPGARRGKSVRLFNRKPAITLIDNSSEACKRLSKDFQHVSVICADSSETGVLESAGVLRADLYVAATGSQSKNFISAQLAKTLGARKVIALAENDRLFPLQHKLDLDAIVCANDAVGAAVLEIVRKGHMRTIFGFYEDDVEIIELRVDGASPVAGLSLRDVELPADVLIAFIMKNDSFIVPSGETVLVGGDEIGLVARKQHITALESIFGGPDER